MLSSIKIENLRSIKDSGYIDLKNLNILVGMNSSGKSTFLRSFPLLSQSINKSLRGPVSWFDVKSVDFGDYETAKNKFALEEETIRFSFKLTLKDVFRTRNYYRYRYINYYNLYNLTQDKNSNIDITLSLNNDSKGTFIDKIIFGLKNFTIDMSVENRTSPVKILINGKIDMTNYGVKTKWNFTTNHGLMPSFICKENEDFQTQTLGLAINTLAQFCDKRFKKQVRIESLFKLLDNSKEELLKSIKKTEIISLQKKTANWDIYNETFQEVYYLWITSQIPTLLWVIDEELKNFYKDCGYIAPSRAEASRYYRNQELQVKDVDSFGRNLQEFISSLTEKQYENYSLFTKEILGINIGVTNTTGHQSIYLQNSNGKFNLADVGFGYSQILPIITKMWFITQKKIYEDNINRCVVIEQPELHLHPAMQAKVADAFIKTIKQGNENNINLIFIIETHSQALINRIGRRIAEHNIDKDSVNLLLFEKDKEGKNSNIKQTSYKDNGQIKDWPYGFFDPSDL
ncbi:DUF3696 domain-containing protein [uncultured Bacteroides sp.]|uniref:AAA family ATPase n=1 Tax=uncultured Bacteroides sp. TaxID=162156 RepID=UPI002AA8AC82|nr:DUF3696 domain-containing protein [uncultured Bacteroides sp.]